MVHLLVEHDSHLCVLISGVVLKLIILHVLIAMMISSSQRVGGIVVCMILLYDRPTLLA